MVQNEAISHSSLNKKLGLLKTLGQIGVRDLHFIPPCANASIVGLSASRFWQPRSTNTLTNDWAQLELVLT